MPQILAIESSCDETAAAVCRDGIILSNIIATQKIHGQYGGVVPELASRAHLQAIVPVVDSALKKAGVSLNEIDAFAFTQAPGLIGALLVGAEFTKSLSLACNKPLIAVHHMQAHVLANLIQSPDKKNEIPSFPFLCLTVSGGHTQIVLCEDFLQMKVIGQTLDDAAGEAFDKSAKLLGLPYPGGPLIDKYAQQGDANKFKFPEPQINELDFSFSGLKNICIAGGVSANSGLRRSLEEMGKQLGWKTFIPPFEYCTDNAAMIAITAHYKYLAGDFAELSIS